jgi:hypothetical protein
MNTTSYRDPCHSRCLDIYGNNLDSPSSVKGVVDDIVMTIVTTFTLYLTLFILKIEDFKIRNTTSQKYPRLLCWFGTYGNHLDLCMYVLEGLT